MPKQVSNFAKCLIVNQEMAKSLLKFCLSCKISPNLVTLILHLSISFFLSHSHSLHFSFFFFPSLHLTAIWYLYYLIWAYILRSFSVSLFNPTYSFTSPCLVKCFHSRQWRQDWNWTQEPCSITIFNQSDCFISAQLHSYASI